MPKRWNDDPELTEQISGNLVMTLAMFPKRLVNVTALVHEYHMPLSHIQILALIERHNLSIGQLSEQLGIAKPNITPLVDALHERGLVERVRSDEDRRIVQVHLLPEGEACLQQIRASVQQQIRHWPAKLGRVEAKRLNEALGVLIAAMDKMEDGIYDD